MLLDTTSRLLRAVLATAALAVPATTALASGVAPRMDNPAQPVNGIEAIDLQELWRRGGEGDELFFGLVVQACAV